MENYNLPGTVFNPTGWDIEGKCAGQKYTVKKFSAKVYDHQTDAEVDFIYDIHHAGHILAKLKYLGLVSLEYGAKAKVKYPDYDEYKKAQIIIGLSESLAYWNPILRSEEDTLDGMKRKGGSANDLHRSEQNIERFKNKIKSLEKWLKDVNGVVKITDKEVYKHEEMPKDMFKTKIKEGKLKKSKDGRFMLDGKFVSKETAEGHPDFNNL